MLNRVLIAGRLTADPELKTTNSGTEVCTITIACDDDYKQKDSDEKKVVFVDVTCWRKTGVFVANYFQKGRMIIVDGKLSQNKWTDKDGNSRSRIEVVADTVYFGDSKRNDSGLGGTVSEPTVLSGSDKDLPF